jgi:protease I
MDRDTWSKERSTIMNRQQLRQSMICLSLLVLLLVGCGGVQAEPTAVPTPVPPKPTLAIGSTRALLVIYPRFEDSEYNIPRAALEDAGVVVTVAAPSLDLVKGYYKQTEVLPDLRLADARGSDYDAIVFVGGTGVDVDDPEAHRVAQEALGEAKVVAAICIAPIILAKAGVVEGKQVTAARQWSTLEKAGAIVVTRGHVVRDGLLITANSPGGAREFGETIVAALGE